MIAIVYYVVRNKDCIGVMSKLELCLRWKGQLICCVTRGREGGRGWRAGGREGGSEGGREGGMTGIHSINDTTIFE